MRNSYLRMFLRMLLIALLAVVMTACSTETATGSVSGYVVNRKAGTAIEGTTVSVVGTLLTDTTDANGFYSIDVPVGTHTLLFEQDGYATTKIEGLEVLEDTTTHYDTIQSEAFDPDLPTTPPDLTVSLSTGDTITADADNEFTFTVSATTTNPEMNMIYDTVVAGIDQMRGFSSLWNSSEPGARVLGFDGSDMDITMSAAGYGGPAALLVAVVDQNLNRTEVVTYVTINANSTGATPQVPDLSGLAVTWGDVAYSSVPFGVDEKANLSVKGLLDAVADSQLVRKDRLSAQSSLDEVITWVDLNIGYQDAEGAFYDAPDSFEIYRKLATESEFRMIGRISPEDAARYNTADVPELIAYVYRDASPSLTAGVEASYQVKAVTGNSSEVSNTFSVTPLEAFYVSADSPADGEDFVSVQPMYEMSFTNAASAIYFGITLTDFVHSGSFDNATLSGGPIPGDTPGVALPQSVFSGGVFTDTLQSYHAYTWMPNAMTSNGELDENGDLIEGTETAVSIAADFFGFLTNVDFPVDAEDGPANTFITGDGSF